METVRGIVTRVLKEDEETGRVFMTVQYESDAGLSVAKLGAYARGVRPGDAFIAEGEWRSSKFQGRTEEIFEGRNLRPDLPRTRAGAERFLTAIFDEKRHGIQAKAIARLLDTRGPEVLAEAVERPELLVQLADRPEARRAAIVAEWESRTQGRRAVNLLEESGLESKVIDRIIGAWQEEALPRLKANPYGAARIPKVGFGNADRVGQHLGIGRTDNRRLSAAVSEVLRLQQERGSTAADMDTLLENMSDVSGIDRDSLRAFLEGVAQRNDQDFAIFQAGQGDPLCSPLNLYIAEAAIVKGIHRLLTRGRRIPIDEVRTAGTKLFMRPEFKRFDAVQRTAVLMAASEPFSIVTGGPGTGKSTVMEAVAELSTMVENGPVFFVAPYGKAAKRLAETTRRKALTVHRLLKARGGKPGFATFDVNADNPLPSGSVVVIDEGSTLDAELTAAVIAALPPDGRLLMVGDEDQLPSVGPGAVLADLLAAVADDRPIIPSVRLVNVYRQGKDSGIALGAAQIRLGEVPLIGPDLVGGVSFTDVAPEALADAVEKLVCETLPAEGYDPLRDVAVLVPQGPGRAGAWDLNRRLSARLNPDGATIPGVFRGQDDDPRMPIPRVGDRVMLTENDADNDVMNGDLGFVVGTGRAKNGRPTIKVKYDCGVEVEMPAAKWRSLILAYAGTIHKAQGSQYLVVVMPFTHAHSRMLERALAYTGWTRARERLYLLGERSALEKAIATYRGGERITLVRRLFSTVRAELLFPPSRPDWALLAREAQAECGLAPASQAASGQAAPGQAASGRTPTSQVSGAQGANAPVPKRSFLGGPLKMPGNGRATGGARSQASAVTLAAAPAAGGKTPPIRPFGKMRPVTGRAAAPAPTRQPASAVSTPEKGMSGTAGTAAATRPFGRTFGSKTHAAAAKAAAKAAPEPTPAKPSSRAPEMAAAETAKPKARLARPGGLLRAIARPAAAEAEEPAVAPDRSPWPRR